MMVFVLSTRTLWASAIDAWRQGNGALVRDLLLEGGEIPPFARAWLADLAGGGVKRPRGRPRVPDETINHLFRDTFGIPERYLCELLLARLEASEARTAGRKLKGDLTPKERALKRTGEFFKMKNTGAPMEPGAVQHVLWPRRAKK